MWDVAQTQNAFWRKEGGKEQWLATTPSPFHPATGGGAEFMTPDQYFKPKTDAVKSVAAVGKGETSETVEKVEPAEKVEAND